MFLQSKRARALAPDANDRNRGRSNHGERCWRVSSLPNTSVSRTDGAVSGANNYLV